METFSALLALCAGNSPVTGECHTQRPVTRSFDVFFHLCLNKRLNKHSWGWWFEASSRPLWRHCDKSLGYYLPASPQVPSWTRLPLIECLWHGGLYIYIRTYITVNYMLCKILAWLWAFCKDIKADMHGHFLNNINTLRPRQMDAISQMTFSNVFSWMKMFDFRLKFHWSLNPMVQLTIFQQWFRWWPSAGQATSHYLKQWWLFYWRIYASLGLSELTM